METNDLLPSPLTTLSTSPKPAGPRTVPLYDELAEKLNSNPSDLQRLALDDVPGATNALRKSNIHNAVQTRGLRVNVLMDANGYIFVGLAAEPSNRGRKRSSYFNWLAEQLRDDPGVWHGVAFDVVPGRTIPIKTSGILTNLRRRGLLVKVCRIDSSRIGIHVVEDFGGGE